MKNFILDNLTDWKREKHLLMNFKDQKILEILNCISNKNKKIVSLLDADLSVYNVITQTAFIVPGNNKLIEKLIRKEKIANMEVLNNLNDKYFNINTLMNIIKLDSTSLLFNILNDLILDESIDYIIVSQSYALAYNFSLLPSKSKLITFFNVPNMKIFNNKRKFFSFNKDPFRHNYNSLNRFLVIY